MIEFIKESCVIGLPHRDFGEAVTALVILQETNQELANYWYLTILEQN